MGNTYDAIVIGGGPGGYVASIRLAQLGKKVLIVEKRKVLGGTCLNVGCIPSKVLLDASEFYHNARNHSSDFGVLCPDVSFNLDKIMERKENIVNDRVKGLEFLMGKNKIEVICGHGKMVSPQKVEVLTEDGEKKEFSASSVILAAGSVPVSLPFVKTDGERIITSDEAISLKKVPEHLLIIGAGAIGLELGSVWKRLGAKVSIVEMMPYLFGNFDRQMSSLLQRNLAAQGVEFYMEHSVFSAQVSGDIVKLGIKDKNENEIELTGDILLQAVGRKANLDEIGLEECGIKVSERGKVEVNPETYETSVKGVYAIGDLIAGPMLAHKAEEEGTAVAEIICGKNAGVCYESIASIVYTEPEFASVGLGEDQLKAKGTQYNSGRFLFKANARAHALNEVEGMVKILSEKESRKILGIHIVGPRASELIAEGAFAMKKGATTDDIIHTVHAHPTLSEVIREAALDTEKRAIHS